MKTLIVYAHPETKGHCPLILKGVEEWHKQHHIDYELIDLYRIKYDPYLHEEEHYTAGNREISGQNREFQEKISQTDRLIFIYPVLWSTMPAAMKGFLDRVFTANFAFNFKPAPIFRDYIGGVPVKLLTGKKAAVFLTTGTVRLLTLLFLGNRFKKIISHDILGFFGIKTRVFHIDKATQLNEKQEIKIKNAVKTGLKWLYS